MTSTTPPVATARDIAYLVELINEARDYAQEIGLHVGFVAVHRVDPQTLDAVVADRFRTDPPRVETFGPNEAWPAGYRSARFPTGTVLFSMGLPA